MQFIICLHKQFVWTNNLFAQTICLHKQFVCINNLFAQTIFLRKQFVYTNNLFEKLMQQYGKCVVALNDLELYNNQVLLQYCILIFSGLVFSLEHFTFQSLIDEMTISLLSFFTKLHIYY